MDVRDHHWSGKRLHLLTPVDLKKYHSNPDGSLEYERRGVDRERECFFRLPVDFPGYLRAMRILDANPVVTGPNGCAKAYNQLGSVLELDMYSFGVKVYIRHGRDGTLKVIAEDSEGRELLAEWSK